MRRDATGIATASDTAKRIGKYDLLPLDREAGLALVVRPQRARLCAEPL
jgi:hypothetical protein